MVAGEPEGQSILLTCLENSSSTCVPGSGRLLPAGSARRAWQGGIFLLEKGDFFFPPPLCSLLNKQRRGRKQRPRRPTLSAVLTPSPGQPDPQSPLSGAAAAPALPTQNPRRGGRTGVFARPAQAPAAERGRRPGRQRLGSSGSRSAQLCRRSSRAAGSFPCRERETRRSNPWPPAPLPPGALTLSSKVKPTRCGYSLSAITTPASPSLRT